MKATIIGTRSPSQNLGIGSRLQEYLKTHHIRRSKTREQVLNLLSDFSKHLELSELLRLAKKKRIAEATVYRSLKLLQEAGLVSRIQTPAGQSFYEISKSHHDHMICRQCGTFIEFHSKALEELQEEIAGRYGFTIDSHIHELYGRCAKCQGRESVS